LGELFSTSKTTREKKLGSSYNVLQLCCLYFEEETGLPATECLDLTGHNWKQGTDQKNSPFKCTVCFVHGHSGRYRPKLEEPPTKG
jgi:hypothetical protein